MYLLLFILWLILNGKLSLEIVLLGLALTALIGLGAWALFGYTPRREVRLLKKLPLFLAYLLVLLWQILKANWTVLGLILRPAGRVEPALIRIRVDLRTAFARYILANSITLTPGTITVEQEGSDYTVHCLHPALLDGIETGIFVRLLKKLEA